VTRAWLLAALLLAGATRPALVDVRSVAPDIKVDLSYAHSRNAFHTRLYSANRALLRPAVAARLARVQARLRKRGLGLKIWDAYRPQSVQVRMWNLRPDGHKLYIANPRKGSKHSRGAAVDLTLVDRTGRELPMPTPHDSFSPLAHRNAVRGVSATARHNRGVLENAMRAEGFHANPMEWWHFDAPDWRTYSLLDAPLVSGGPKAGAGRW
jgi:D-alanyl-D-alanine dipeptidase